MQDERAKIANTWIVSSSRIEEEKHWQENIWNPKKKTVSQNTVAQQQWVSAYSKPANILQPIFEGWWFVT